ncbi:hypothetical protein [Sphingomonas sp.]|uniref:hypothetical protein n=1 Tax=Sphingomonas sp. TaxID=28214 RepID=UPI002ED8CFA0
MSAATLVRSAGAFGGATVDTTCSITPRPLTAAPGWHGHPNPRQRRRQVSQGQYAGLPTYDPTEHFEHVRRKGDFRCSPPRSLRWTASPSATWHGIARCATRPLPRRTIPPLPLTAVDPASVP